MELTKQDMNQTKGVAIIMMLLLHLFCRKDFEGLYVPFLYIGEVPLIYYIGLFGDACVPIYCFASGLGLYKSFTIKYNTYSNANKYRILKLLINFWIIMISFVSIGHFVNPSLYPRSIMDFFLNMFLLTNSYNGAWWFLQTYVLLVFLSPLLLNLIKKYNAIFTLIITGTIYLLAYLQRFKSIIDFGEILVINIIINAIVLLGTSLFPFAVGALFAKYEIYSKISILINKKIEKLYKNLICFFLILMLIVFHGFIESVIVAPFTAIAFICIFNLMNKYKLIVKTFNFFGNHSTNIWLTHMFFYMIIFPELTFAPKYPILILIWLIVLCLISSYLINLLYLRIIKFINTKITNNDFSRVA